MEVPGQSQVTYGFDEADQLRTIAQGSSIVSFEYDDAGRRTSHTLPNGILTEYTYDAASRLTALTYKLGGNTLGTLTYDYNDAGERVAIGGTWARTLQPSAVSSGSYNEANRQLTFAAQTLTYDLNGNLMTDGTNTYTWNARNQLVAIAGPTPATFSYDASGRRKQETISGTTTDFLYDGVNAVQEQTGVATSNILIGLVIDERFVRSNATETRYLTADALNSTVALADGAGNIQTTYTYEAFGATTVSGAATNAYRYTGREDDGTGLYYYRARYYHPSLQRFISEDPTGFKDGVNLYAYVHGNPVSYLDPLGLWRLEGGAPYPKNPRVAQLITGLENCLAAEVVVTSTHEPQGRTPGDAHTRSDAFDMRYPKDPDRALCCAARAGAATARDEKKHPVPGTKGDHIHISIVPGRPTNPGGPRGNLPGDTCACQ